MKPAAWLQKFGSSLERGDIDAAAGMFEPESYWRDLVSFTWNLKTCEGRAEIKAMLAARLADVKPRNFLAKTSEWFTFETALGRGIGHLRLRGKRCWTLLTTLQELKGFEEKRETGLPAAPSMCHPWAPLTRNVWCACCWSGVPPFQPSPYFHDAGFSPGLRSNVSLLVPFSQLIVRV